MSEDDESYAANNISIHNDEKSVLLPVSEEGKETSCCSSLWRKFWVCASALMAYSAAFIIFWPLTQQYIYHRFAVEKFGNDSAANSADAGGVNPCITNSSDTNSSRLQEEIQSETSTMVLYLTLASAIPATCLSLVFGSYSDQLGRRLLFLLPLLGNLARGVLTAFVIHYQLSLYFLLAGNLVEGITGSFFVVILAGFAFVADITPPTRTRTVAMAALEAMFSFVGAFAQVSVW